MQYLVIDFEQASYKGGEPFAILFLQSANYSDYYAEGKYFWHVHQENT